MPTKRNATSTLSPSKDPIKAVPKMCRHALDNGFLANHAVKIQLIATALGVTQSQALDKIVKAGFELPALLAMSPVAVEADRLIEIQKGYAALKDAKAKRPSKASSGGDTFTPQLGQLNLADLKLLKSAHDSGVEQISKVIMSQLSHDLAGASVARQRPRRQLDAKLSSELLAKIMLFSELTMDLPMRVQDAIIEAGFQNPEIQALLLIELDDASLMEIHDDFARHEDELRNARDVRKAAKGGNNVTQSKLQTLEMLIEKREAFSRAWAAPMHAHSK